MDMAKAFPGKRVDNFLRLQQTQDYIKELESKLESNHLEFQVIETVRGRYGGIWFHELLALKFAAWLSPK
jgi:hypothetical protein